MATHSLILTAVSGRTWHRNVFANSGGKQAKHTHTHTAQTQHYHCLHNAACRSSYMHRATVQTAIKLASAHVCATAGGEGRDQSTGPQMCVCVCGESICAICHRRIWAGNSVLHFKHSLISTFFYAKHFENKDILCSEFSLKTFDHVCHFKIKIMKS